MIRIIALTEQGYQLGQKLLPQFSQLNKTAQADAQVTLMFKPQPFTEQVQAAFRQGDTLVFVCAMGIVFRTLGPVLQDKYSDPPVLVLDEQGQFVVPVLSGHEGGANDLGRRLAQILGAQLVLTTAQPYLNPMYVVGMGCERGCPEHELRSLLQQCLEQVELSLAQISGIASIDIKADEEGLLALANSLDIPFTTWPATKLKAVEHQLSVRSDYVFETVGVYGVAESAALYTLLDNTGADAELVLTKQKTRKATCAIARGYQNDHNVMTIQQQQETT